jgi:hypothetical protein
MSRSESAARMFQNAPPPPTEAERQAGAERMMAYLAAFDKKSKYPWHSLLEQHALHRSRCVRKSVTIDWLALTSRSARSLPA